MIKTVFDGEKLVVLENESIPAVKDRDDILIKVASASLCGTDLHILSGGLPLKKVPLTLGHEYAGIVEDVGGHVNAFKPGDRVFGSPFIPCGSCFYCTIQKPQLCMQRLNVGITIDGAFEEFLLLPKGQNCLHHLPDAVSFEEGALFGDMAATSAYAVERAGIQKEDFVVILGLGPIGLSAIPFLKAKGAGKIVAVTRSKHKLDFAKKIGADYAVNPEDTPIRKLVKSLTNGVGADAVIETASVQKTIEDALSIVRKGGRVSTIGVYEKKVTLDMKKIVLHELDLVGSMCPVDDTWIKNMIAVMNKNVIDLSPFITHRFSLKEIHSAFHIFKNKLDGCIKVVINM